MDSTDQPSSICHVQNIQMYELPQTDHHLQFKLLSGEAIFHSGTSVDGLLLLTNYRLYIQNGDLHHHIPLGLIEIVEHRDLFYLHIGCKDARTYRCIFGNNESCLEWFDRISKAAEPPRQLEQLFAFYHYIWAKARADNDKRIQNVKQYTFDYKLFKDEMERLQFEGDSWRISEANKNYKLCPTYPPYLIVPSCINDETLECVAKFRSSRRIPAVVWRHVRNGAVIARCSQPEVGWLGWRSAEDEDLIKAISQACNFDQRIDKESMLSHSPASLNSEDSIQQISTELQQQINNKEKKVLIMDARSYTTAVANRARGGGCECPEYYPNCEIQFMNLANIHSIRKSFHALRLLCTSSADQPTWFSQLEGTRWLQHMSGLMKAAVTLVNAVEREARPVLVHCSDGWDRTPQIIALAELLLDPYYRTIDGFRILIEREWLAFGHKFADRCGHSSGSDDQNERCPVFLQWLDCVHQLLLQFSCAFEFSQTYLVKLAQHIYSNLYGTFLSNTFQERMRMVNGKTFSVWEFLNSAHFKNHLYAPPGNTCCGTKVLWPQCNVRDLQLWNEVYLGSWELTTAATTTTTTASNGDNTSSGTCPGPPGADSSPSHNNCMTKTRSYGDLKNAADYYCSNQFRRSSDPSINNKLNVLTTTTTTDTVTTTTTQENGTNNENGFLCSSSSEEQQNNDDEGIDDIDCNNDCIYKTTTTTPLFKIDSTPLLLNGNGFLQQQQQQHSDVQMQKKTEIITNDKCEINNINYELNHKCIIIDKNNDDLTPSPSIINFNNTDLIQLQNDIDSDNELTEKSESKSENTTICCDLPSSSAALLERSVETSTDTLVSSENNPNIISSSPEMNGFEKVQSPIEITNISLDQQDGCKVCAKNLKFVNDSHNSSREKSKCLTNSPLYSRTSSCSGGWDNRTNNTWHSHSLGDDGLIPVRSPAQERLWQIIEEHKRKEELLEKELHTYRQALINQFCHKCSNTDNEKIDETFDDNSESSKSSKSCSPQRITSPVVMIKTGSVVESVGSVGEGQASAVESLRSDMSWEALEENSILTECTATLWVPDHAVSRCTGCQTEFWVGKRKHHCRKCGRIFCASCSENSTPLPSEQLYEPVRVCTGCYSKLRRDCGELPDQCKHTNGHHQPTNTNQQITASSN